MKIYKSCEYDELAAFSYCPVELSRTIVRYKCIDRYRKNELMFYVTLYDIMTYQVKLSEREREKIKAIAKAIPKAIPTILYILINVSF